MKPKWKERIVGNRQERGVVVKSFFNLIIYFRRSLLATAVLLCRPSFLPPHTRNGSTGRWSSHKFRQARSNSGMTLAKINGFSSITSVGICVFLTVYLALKNALLLLWFLNFGIADSGLCVCLKTTKTPAIVIVYLHSISGSESMKRPQKFSTKKKNI